MAADSVVVMSSDGKTAASLLPFTSLPAGSPAWGTVTGTLANQTDLKAALDAKGTSNFSGAYADLTSKPTLGTAAAAATTDFATAAQGTLATGAAAKASNLSDLVSASTARTNLGLGTLATQSGTFSGTSSGTNTGDQTSFIGTAIGYATGAGGTVSQATSKSTGVTLSKLCGAITMNAAALAAATIVTFTVTNTLVAATDVITCQHDSGGTVGAYTVMPNTPASGSFKISVRNNTASSLSEALVIRFAVIKAVVA